MDVPIEFWTNILTNAPIAVIFGVIIYILWNEYQDQHDETILLLRKCLGYDDDDDGE